jgi:L-ornithine N5-oxygenase
LLTRESGQNPVYDIVGIGFGPANLALAIAIEEHNAGAPSDEKITAAFIERQPGFSWHRGMLIEGAVMQISFLKDLATMRNPTSDFGFVPYLHSQGRLVDFINHKILFPSREEFHDYLSWAAGSLSHVVRYGYEASRINMVSRGGTTTLVDVVCQPVGGAGQPRTYRARNLVLAVGLSPTVPAGVRLSDRVWHSSELLHRVRDLPIAEPRRFVVVGAGQSAAECTDYLHRTYPRAEVCAVFSRYGYSPADDSPFANRVFDPAAVDQFYTASPEVKRLIMGYHANTNYSVVDTDLIEELYRRVYQEKVTGTRRLRLFNVSRVVETVETGEGIRATVESLTTHERTVLDCDAIVYATGYRPTDPVTLLGDLGRWCQRDDTGALRIARDYRLETSPELGGGLYLQGSTEHTHGISSSLLSTTAVRAGQILDSIVTRVPAQLAVSR